jgi:hypothetical protein
MQTVKLFFWGRKQPVYSGWDPIADCGVRIKKGESFEVSGEKAEQLLKDYPSEFELVPEAATSIPSEGETKKVKGKK